ncbi:MAG TPA: DUF370 domain-containing protein [Clostridiales bacterium]|jgi:regulator of extracellular matrix RemA (YlzA/DUF370 family)|nr:DUF370 domain-containing protein [Clostridiales bacterium]
MRFINIGFGNRVCDERIVALMSPDSSPVKRLVSEAKESARVIDATCGRKTRTVIITDSEHVILSAVKIDTVSARLNGTGEELPDEDAQDAQV